NAGTNLLRIDYRSLDHLKPAVSVRIRSRARRLLRSVGRTARLFLDLLRQHSAAVRISPVGALDTANSRIVHVNRLPLSLGVRYVATVGTHCLHDGRVDTSAVD